MGVKVLTLKSEKLKNEGANKLGRLIILLNKDGRTEDVNKAALDEKTIEKLYKEFNIE